MFNRGSLEGDLTHRTTAIPAIAESSLALELLRYLIFRELPFCIVFASLTVSDKMRIKNRLKHSSLLCFLH